MDAPKVALGLVLLAASTAILFATTPAGDGLPLFAATLAALGLAAGALLIGTSAQSGRPV